MFVRLGNVLEVFAGLLSSPRPATARRVDAWRHEGGEVTVMIGRLEVTFAGPWTLRRLAREAAERRRPTCAYGS